MSVFKPDHVVFAQIAARWSLNDFDRYCAGVGESKKFTQGDVGGLIFTKGKNLFPVGNIGSSSPDDLVLSAVMVFLQAEAGSGLDLDAFNLERPPSSMLSNQLQGR